MSFFTLLPPLPPTEHALPLMEFYFRLLLVPPMTLALTLAGITGGLLLLRLLDGRPAPLLVRAAALLTAGLALAQLTGMVSPYWPLATATAGVLLLLLDEAVHLLVRTLQLLALAFSDLVADARRLLAPARKDPQPDAVSDAS